MIKVCKSIKLMFLKNIKNDLCKVMNVNIMIKSNFMFTAESITYYLHRFFNLKMAHVCFNNKIFGCIRWGLSKHNYRAILLFCRIINAYENIIIITERVPKTYAKSSLLL